MARRRAELGTAAACLAQVSPSPSPCFPPSAWTLRSPAGSALLLAASPGGCPVAPAGSPGPDRMLSLMVIQPASPNTCSRGCGGQKSECARAKTSQVHRQPVYNDDIGAVTSPTEPASLHARGEKCM